MHLKIFFTCIHDHYSRATILSDIIFFNFCSLKLSSTFSKLYFENFIISILNIPKVFHQHNLTFLLNIKLPPNLARYSHCYNKIKPFSNLNVFRFPQGDVYSILYIWHVYGYPSSTYSYLHAFSYNIRDMWTWRRFGSFPSIILCVPLSKGLNHCLEKHFGIIIKGQKSDQNSVPNLV